MTVYIEYVIIDNFVFTYIIGLLSYRALKIDSSKIRNTFSSILGTVCAVLYPLMNLSTSIILSLKIFLGIILSIILFYKKSKLLISSVVFFGITFLFGGVFFGIGYCLKGDVKTALTMPIVDFPIGLIIIVTVIVYFLTRRLLLKFNKNRDSRADIYKVELEVFGKTLTTQGFCDTGNRLYDTKTGLAIVVASFSHANQILSPESIIRLLTGEGEKSYENARFIEYRPYGSKPQRLWLVKPQKFLLYFEKDKNIHIDIMLGLSIHSFSDAENYELIFGTSLKAKIP